MSWTRRRLAGALLALLSRARSDSAPAVIQRRPVSQLDGVSVKALKEAYRRLENEGDSAWTLEGLQRLHADHCGAAMDIHKNWGFLPWHRALVLLHERVLGSLLCQPDFRLPYWDWERGVPKIYEEPDDESNPLWRPKRHTKPQIQAFISPNRYKEMLFPIQFTGPVSFGGDNPGEGTGSSAWPHRKIHTTISNEMGDITTAARDPLFFIHHAAVDRLWEIWAKMQPQPVFYPAEWRARSHQFPAIRQEKTSWCNEELLQTGALGYEYFSLDPPVIFEGNADPVEISASSPDVLLPSATVEKLSTGAPAGLDIYFWFGGLGVRPNAERLYTVWMTPLDKREPAHRFPVVGTFQGIESASELSLNLPLVMAPDDLVRISSAAAGGFGPGVQLRYISGEGTSDPAPEEAAVVRFETVTAVARRSRIVSVQ